MPETEYILFCDESDTSGKYFSNFYGGVIVGASQYQRITDKLNRRKQELGFFGEVKWSKVTEAYRDKYIALIKEFFEEMRAGHLRTRVMFTQNSVQPIGLTAEQKGSTYFLLYYQFAKHAFGLRHRPLTDGSTRLRLYYDAFLQKREAVAKFREFIVGLQDDAYIRATGLSIKASDVAEINSHDHVLAQCLDVVFGSMSFRLKDKHREKPPGSWRRGKKTVAKETVYKAILAEIRSLYPGFNIGVSTGWNHRSERWSMPYRHWNFEASKIQFRPELAKPRKN